MLRKHYFILILSCIVIIALSVGITAKLYKDQIDKQFGIKTIAEIETSIANLNISISSETADLRQLEEQVNSKKQIIATLSWELSIQEKKQKDIKTAIYYLNKSLWLEQK